MGATRTVLCLAVLVPTLARAACGDAPGDAAAVAAARDAVTAACDCDAAVSHGAYVACVNATLRERVEAGELSAACRKVLTRCAARSTCGRPGAVTCCTTNARGRTRCAVKRDPARCRAPSGGSACVGSLPSCCDACVAGGGATTTTTTTTSTTSTTFVARLCSGGTLPECAGICPAGSVCRVGFPFDESPACRCYPEDVVACTHSGYPTCGGACPEDGVCQALPHLRRSRHAAGSPHLRLRRPGAGVRPAAPGDVRRHRRVPGGAGVRGRQHVGWARVRVHRRVAG